MTKFLHIEIDKCEDCPFRQWMYESIGSREKEGDWCYHPDKLEWVSKNFKIFDSESDYVGKWQTKKLYEGDFPEDCPLENMVKI